MWLYNSTKEFKKEINQIFKYCKKSNIKAIVNYVYDNNKEIGMLYGWFKENWFFIDLVFVDERFRRKGNH